MEDGGWRTEDGGWRIEDGGRRTEDGQNGRLTVIVVSRPGVLKEADEFVTRVHAETVETFIATERIDPATVDIVGFHGQTVIHKPAEQLTVQIGDGAALARRGSRTARSSPRRNTKLSQPLVTAVRVKPARSGC